LVREIKRFNSEEEVIGERKKVIATREKKRCEEEERLVKGKKRGRIIPKL